MSYEVDSWVGDLNHQEPNTVQEYWIQVGDSANNDHNRFLAVSAARRIGLICDNDRAYDAATEVNPKVQVLLIPGAG